MNPGHTVESYRLFSRLLGSSTPIVDGKSMVAMNLSMANMFYSASDITCSGDSSAK